MKRVAFGIVTGGAAAAAFLASATAHADTSDPVTWTPSYDLDGAQVLQDPSLGGSAWTLPASFTSSTGTTLTGWDFVGPSAGGYDDEFLGTAGTGAFPTYQLYDQDQLAPGITNLYYDPDVEDGNATLVDELKTPFGTFNLSSFAPLLPPGDLQEYITMTPLQAAMDADPYPALGLNLPSGITTADETGAQHLGTATLMQTSSGGPVVWQLPDTSYTFTPTDGGSATTLTGTDYLVPSAHGYGTEFVTTGGALYDQGPVGLGMTNLYYDSDPGSPTATVVDQLQTPFGNVDLPAALATALFGTPTDYATETLTAASPLTELQDAGLYSALDLGLAPAAGAAAEAFDPSDLFGSLPF